MSQLFEIDIERVWTWVLVILLSVAGGLAQIIHRKDEQNLTWRRMLGELFVSGFAGIMVFNFIESSGIFTEWIGFISGMAGWGGPKVLDVLYKSLLQTLKLRDGNITDNSDNFNKNNKNNENNSNN